MSPINRNLKFKLSPFLKVLIKLFQKFFEIQRRNVGRAPQSAKSPYAALASVKKKRKFGYEIPKFWLVFQAALTMKFC